MDVNMQMTGTNGTAPQHSSVIVNFVAALRRQLKNSTYYVFPNNVKYIFKTEKGEVKMVVPDASINCRIKIKRGNTFLNVPRFVMEVLSPETEKYDRGKKMDLYRQQEIDEYWIVDWKKKRVEIHELNYEDGAPKYVLRKEVTEKNKEELRIVTSPNFKITFDELFEEVDDYGG